MSHEQYQACIDACHACLIACEHCSAECLKEDDVKKMARCIELDKSCSDVCGFAAREMARGSQFLGEACLICAQICDECGAECRKHEAAHCQQCADACKRCADECRKMSGKKRKVA